MRKNLKLAGLDRDILSNSTWLILEKFLGVFGVLLVNSYMAKYIGPENFGKLTFVISIFIFVQTLSWFGSKNIIFKHLSKNTKSGIRLALASQAFRFKIFTITSIITLAYLWITADKLTFIFGLGNCIASYFLVADIYTIYFNSQLQSIVNALSNTLGIVLSLLARFGLVFFMAEPYTMVIPIIILSFIPYTIRKYYFKSLNVYPKHIKSNRRYNKYIAITGGSLVLSTLSITTYTQISNIFLAKLTSFSDLAVYNVALTFGSSWGFINIAIATSFLPKIYASSSIKTEILYLRQVFIIIIAVTFIVMVGLYFLGSYFINLLYGPDFLEAEKILPLMVLATMFSALGTISYRYMIKLNAYKYLSIKMILVSLLSIPMSYFAIKLHGVYGAALTYLLIEIISLTIGNYFLKNGIMWKIHLRTMGLSNDKTTF